MLNGGSIEKKLSKKKKQEQAERELLKEEYTEGIYGKALTDPILGHFFKVVEKDVGRHEFQLDTSFSYVSQNRLKKKCQKNFLFFF